MSESARSAVARAEDAGHVLELIQGPCSEYRHAGQPCRVHTWRCTCMDLRRRDQMVGRHTVDDKNASRWARDEAIYHARGAVS